MSRTFLTATVAAALALVMLAAPAFALTKAGAMFPATLKVKAMDGEAKAVVDLAKEKATAIVFFNTACKVCLEEIGWLLKNYQDRNNIFVSIDLAGVPAIERYKKTYLKDYPDVVIYLDQEFTVPSEFGLSTTPSSVLLDKEGKVVKVLVGFDETGHKAIEDLYK